MKTRSGILVFVLLTVFIFSARAQDRPVSLDSTISIDPAGIAPGPVKKQIKLPDSSAPRINYARNAALRSAILPGWGQAYNKKYWKMPIVYAGLGISAYVFLDNISVYREYRFAYSARIKAQSGNPADSVDYYQLKELYRIIDPASIRNARDEFRRYIDYSVVSFILLWGLNVVDAAVDAHLRTFDISPDLSMKIKPQLNPFYSTAGISVVFTIGRNRSK